MKKINSISSLINVLTHNPSPDNDENYSKFIKIPSFVTVSEDDDAKKIVKKAFKHIPCFANDVNAPTYYLVASYIFADDDTKVFERYSPLSEDIASDVFSYFFRFDVYAGKLSVLRIDVFKALGARENSFVESQYVDTIVFYNE